jgi:hypothetical protein
LSAAPTPVITPQPIKQARSNGISFRNRNSLLIGHDAVFAERSQKHQLPKRAAIGQHGAIFAIKRQRLRPFVEILLAQDRCVAVAIKAMPAVRIP